MQITRDQRIPEVCVFVPSVFRDNRGEFCELYNEERYAALGLDARFVQDNVSRSGRHVLRGLHMQYPRAQGKLVSVLEGAVFDVAVDLRRGSQTFGKWTGYELTRENGYQLWIPPGFAHGFVVLSEEALFSYKCTDVYVPAHERSIRWNDPSVAIQWPIAAPVLSVKDAAAPTLAEIPLDELPLLEELVPSIA